MSHLFSAVEDLFKSFYEMIAAVVGTIVHLGQTFVMAIVNFFTSIVRLVTDVLSGVVDVAGGVGKFIAGKYISAAHSLANASAHNHCDLGNIVILGIVAAGGFLYIRAQQQGRRPAAATTKTTN